jgi:hypothetical protein
MESSLAWKRAARNKCTAVEQNGASEMQRPFHGKRARLRGIAAACEYLRWLGVSVKLRIMTRGEVETINEPDRGHLRISLLIVLGDLAFRVRRTGYVWGGKVWIEVYDADSLKSMNRSRVCCKTQARASTAANAIIKSINKEIALQAKHERCR